MADTGFDNGARTTPIDSLPFREEDRNRIYDPRDPQIKSWLKSNWMRGYNPLAAGHTDHSNAMQLSLPDGRTYNYSEPGHSYEHYRQNRDGPPKYLVHITKAGWVEYAIKENNGMIGKEDQVWTGAYDPGRWWGGNFPEGYKYTEPPDRFVELMFDAEKLRKMGYETVSNDDYYLFGRRLPLEALVPTSKTYVSQVLGFTMPDKT